MPSRDDRKGEFVNARDATAALYWRDCDGNEAHDVGLPPGMTTMMSTFGSHVWVSRDMSNEVSVGKSVSESGSPTQHSLPSSRRPRCHR